ncbi:TPA: DNA-binding protein [Pseudomonas aeruginosa]|nr:DNA-binding protein [Pseudomonas aeruginosa]
MSRPTEYSDEMIIAAGLALVKPGERPLSITSFRVHKQLGGGKYSRVSRVWSAYLESAAGAEPTAEVALPADIEAKLATIAGDLQLRLAALITEAHALLCQEFAVKAAALEQRFLEQKIHFDSCATETGVVIESLERQLDEASAAAAALKDENEGLSSQLTELKLQLREQSVAGRHLQEMLEVRTSDLSACRSNEESLRIELNEVNGRLIHSVTRQEDLSARLSEVNQLLDQTRSEGLASRARELSLSGQALALQEARRDDAEAIERLTVELRGLESVVGELRSFRASAEAVLASHKLEVPGHPFATPSEALLPSPTPRKRGAQKGGAE